MLYVVGASCARGPDLIGIVGIMQGDPQTERYLYHFILRHTRACTHYIIIVRTNY